MTPCTLLKSTLQLIDITAAEAMDWVLEDRGCYASLSAHSKKRMHRKCLAGWREGAAGQGVAVRWALCVQKEEGLCGRTLKKRRDD